MRTAALCPTCHHPFSFWKIVSAFTPDSIVCTNCRSQIVVRDAQKYVWGFLAALGIITLILFQFITPRDWLRFVLLLSLWVISFEALEIIISLIIVNRAEFSRADEAGR